MSCTVFFGVLLVSLFRNLVTSLVNAICRVLQRGWIHNGMMWVIRRGTLEGSCRKTPDVQPTRVHLFGGTCACRPLVFFQALFGVHRNAFTWESYHPYYSIVKFDLNYKLSDSTRTWTISKPKENLQRISCPIKIYCHFEIKRKVWNTSQAKIK